MASAPANKPPQVSARAASSSAPPAPEARVAQPEAPAQKLVVDPPVRRPTASELETALRAAQAAADHQDESIYPPDVALPGVSIKDAPETLRVEPKVAALPTPPVAAITPRPEVREGQPAWLSYAVPPPALNGRPMIAIVIDDMGVDRRRTAKVSDLPGPLTASFLTYAPNGAAQAKEARAKGHELMIHVPMEPSSAAVDPGPGALRVGMSRDAILRNLDKGLSNYTGFVGINNHMGSRFTADAKGMEPVIAAVKARGLLWLDSRTSPDSVGIRLAQKAGVPFAERHVFLDHHNSLKGVLEQLDKVEQTARRYGHAVAIGHPKDHTIAGLKQWLPTLAGKGFVLVPLSTIVRVREGTG